MRWNGGIPEEGELKRRSIILIGLFSMQCTSRHVHARYSVTPLKYFPPSHVRSKLSRNKLRLDKEKNEGLMKMCRTYYEQK